MINITKEFSSNVVLDNVNLSIKEGEIHGLVGENGAGKSTLMNILFSMPVIHSTGGYSGEIYFDGKKYNPKSPMEAMNTGIGMVHQEFMLLPGFTITENIKLNRENTKENLISRIFGKKLETLDFEKMRSDSKNALKKLDMSLDEYMIISGLPVGYLQFIEIAREFDKDNLKLLVLDEPTAVLTENESSKFLNAVKKLSNMGISILFISHRLDEVKKITDSITILRDGKEVINGQTNDFSFKSIAKYMVGRDLDLNTIKKKDELKDDYTLEIEDLVVNMPGEKVKGVDLKIRRGEILGIGGLAGQGKVGISNGIMGLYNTRGRILKDNVEIPLNNPKETLNHSIAFLSEDRRGVGLLLEESIEFNMAITKIEVKNGFTKKIGPFNLIDKKSIRNHALQMIDTLDIRCTSPKQLTKYLSGGNQQKICIARALTLEPDILLVSEPTRGIDVGAKKLVLDALIELNEKHNMTIIFTSSELAELRLISDRIAIIYDGKLNGILPPDAKDEEFGLLMAGESLEKVVD